MFGYVTANRKELTPEQLARYRAVYCGICRSIRAGASQTARLALSYDMAFLALLLMSLYEPEEVCGDRACLLHPRGKRTWVDNDYIRYAADMNVALGYYKTLDDVTDEGRADARLLLPVFQKAMPGLQRRYPRQCAAMEACIRELRELEEGRCANPDLPAAAFGKLMGELLVYREDLWAPTLRQMGLSLGRYIYLLDAALDYRRDRRKKLYNPFLEMGTGLDIPRWEEYLVLEMADCCACFERLPLVQDKAILDSILYSGVWMAFERARGKRAQEERT